MKKKSLTVACATTLFAALLTGSASSASAHAPCGKTGPDLDHRAYSTATTGGANIRTGSSTSCTSVGTLLAGHTIDYHCFTHPASGGDSWSYLRNVSTGKTGWVRDDLLPGYGSRYHCGF
jgi:uncharacterized membrane protein